MIFIDSHAHILRSLYSKDLEREIEIIERENFFKINDVGFDIESSKEALEIAERSVNFFATVGIHPEELTHFKEGDINLIEELGRKNKVIAIGETGLDYYNNDVALELQRDIFSRQIEIAKSLNIPVIIHSREAFDDTMCIIKEIGYNNAVFHSFDYGLMEVKSVLDFDCSVSFSGMLTFKKRGDLREVAEYIPLENVLFETDSPYLSPEPLRGRKNRPQNVKYIYEFFARLRGIDIEVLCERVLQNFKGRFKKAYIEEEQCSK